MAKKPTNPWLKREWQLLAVAGPALPLMIRREKPRKGENQFKLVIGSSTGSRINSLKVKFDKGKMTKHWSKCVLVPRGTDPLLLVDKDGKAIPPLPDKPTEEEVTAIADKLVEAVNTNGQITTSRLECDLTLPDENGGEVFGELRLFQVEKALGARRLLVVDFAVQNAQPGGSGGGGSITP